jgi:RNA polymerase sigma factor (TIGR02999 family)
MRGFRVVFFQKNLSPFAQYFIEDLSMRPTASCVLEQPAPDPESVTALLSQLRAGDRTAMDRLFPIVYAELQRLADSCLRRERPGHTLQRTALVHEAYLRLVGQHQPDCQNRAHFLGIAARIMRQILVDHARKHKASKRDGGTRLSLDEALDTPVERDSLMIDLDEALDRLARRNERRAQLIEMRFFGGLTAEETSVALRLPVLEVRRELRLAQAWIEREMGQRGGRVKDA